jgi:hypothetical protein
VQALARNVSQLRKLLEPQRRIDQIAQDHPRSLGLAADQQRRRLIKQLLRKCRIPLDIRLLSALGSATEQHDQRIAILRQVDPVPWPPIDSVNVLE